MLAAGRGARLGGPKALLAWPGPDGDQVPLAAAHAEQRLRSDSARVLVVTRAAVAAVLAGWLPPAAELVCSEAPDELGPAGSIAAAVSGRTLEGLVLITPVDAVPASAPTVSALLASFAADPECLAARPTHGGRGGHPVLLRAAALERYRVSDPPPLRDVMRSLGARRCDVSVADSTVLSDLDTLEDLAELGVGPPRFVGAREAAERALQS